jgi:hypothetical protein
MVYLYPPGDSQQTPAADATWFLRPPNACDSLEHKVHFVTQTSNLRTR